MRDYLNCIQMFHLIFILIHACAFDADLRIYIEKYKDIYYYSFYLAKIFDMFVRVII